MHVDSLQEQVTKLLSGVSDPTRLLVIWDANNHVHRLYHGLPELTSPQGIPTHAVYGWISCLWSVQDALKLANNQMLAVFDGGGRKRASLLVEGYKANRQEEEDKALEDGFAAEEQSRFDEQLQLAQAFTVDMGVAVYKIDGVEADDVIATLATLSGCERQNVLIMSSDKDLGQCVGECKDAGGIITRVLQARASGDRRSPWQVFDAAGIEERLGVPPHQVPELLALAGDTSDNIVGLVGVGFKTAAKWLREYGSFNDVFENRDKLPERFRCQLEQNGEQLLRNLEATTLQTFADGWPPCESVLIPNHDTVVQVMLRLGMAATVKKYRARYGLQTKHQLPV